MGLCERQMNSFERIFNALNSHVVEIDHAGIYQLAGLFEDNFYLNKNEPVIVNEETFHLIDHDFSGNRSEGETWIVFHLEGEDALYRIKGLPSSWDGTTWDLSSLEKVERVPKIVYTYNRV